MEIGACLNNERHYTLIQTNSLQILATALFQQSFPAGETQPKFMITNNADIPTFYERLDAA